MYLAYLQTDRGRAVGLFYNFINDSRKLAVIMMASFSSEAEPITEAANNFWNLTVVSSFSIYKILIVEYVFQLLTGQCNIIPSTIDQSTWSMRGLHRMKAPKPGSIIVDIIVI